MQSQADAQLPHPRFRLAMDAAGIGMGVVAPDGRWQEVNAALAELLARSIDDLPGQPAIDEAGVVGQVTRVFPFSAEITLITDKDQAVPVQVVRSGQRSVVFGLGGGQLELRYLPANADIKEGDLLVTSGLDGIFLPGFPVARVSSIERENSYAFARIRCEPLAAVENFGEVLVLAPRQPLPPRPPESAGRGGNTGAPVKEDKK